VQRDCDGANNKQAHEQFHEAVGHQLELQVHRWVQQHTTRTLFWQSTAFKRAWGVVWCVGGGVVWCGGVVWWGIKIETQTSGWM